MKFIETKCKSCGAVLDIDPDRMTAECPWCGSRLVLEAEPSGADAEKKQAKAAAKKEKKQAKLQAKFEKKKRKEERKKKTEKSGRRRIVTALVLCAAVLVLLFVISRIRL